MAVKIIGESNTNPFPMKIRCRYVVDGNGFGYGKEADFCGRELEITEESDIKKHKWFKYPDYSGVDYGVVCPGCGMFVIVDEKKIPRRVLERAKEISLRR